MSSLERLKISTIKWHSDKEPHQYERFISDFSSMVRVLKHGAALEDFLDQKLNRKQGLKAVTPSFITEDPDFDLPDSMNAHASDNPFSPEPRVDEEDEEQEIDQAESNAPPAASPNASTATRVLAKAQVAYKNLSQESIELDGLLFSTFKQCVIGTRSALFELVGDRPSYVRACCLLHRHCMLSSWQRRLRAIEGLSGLNYDGQIHRFQLDCMRLVTEIYNSKVTIIDIIMAAIQKSFSGKSKHIQWRVAESINARLNNPDPEQEEPNIFDTVQSYLSDIAAVGDGVQHPVNFTGSSNSNCGRCGRDGHATKDCFAKRHVQGHQLTTPAPSRAPPREQSKGGKGRSPSRKGNKGSGKGRPQQIKNPRTQYLNRSTSGTTSSYGINNATAATKGGRGQNATSKSKPITQSKQPSKPMNTLFTQKELGTLKQLMDTVPTQSLNVLFTDVSKKQPGVNTSQQSNTQGGEQIISSTEEVTSNNAIMHVQAKSDENSGIRVLSLFDGIGCLAMSLQQLGITVENYIAVESNPEARTMSKYANKQSSTFPGVTHRFHNVEAITADDLKSLGRIDLVGAGPPCNDYSSLRLRNNTNTSLTPSQMRPGYKGSTGKLFLTTIKIWHLLHAMPGNEHCQFLFENVDFSDLKDSFDIINNSLQVKPVTIQAREHSCTHRKRLYWTNIGLAAGWRTSSGPIDPNTMLDTGREVARATTLTANWVGNPDKPYQYTSAPFLVRDIDTNKVSPLRPAEAERLMGIEPGAISTCPKISNREKLRAIGGAWDIRVINMILQHSHAAKHPDIHAVNRLAKTAQAMATLPSNSCHVSAMNGRETIIDSGASRHIDTATVVKDESDRYSISGFNGQSAWTQGSGTLDLVHVNRNGNTIRIMVDDADKFESTRPILSLGKLLADGYSFVFQGKGKDLAMYTPEHTRVDLEMGPDHIIVLKHNVTSAKRDRGIYTVQRQVKGMSAELLHLAFGHIPAERLQRTLEKCVDGFKLKAPLIMDTCHACALGKSRRAPIGRGTGRRGYNATKQPTSSDVMMMQSGASQNCPNRGQLNWPSPSFTHFAKVITESEEEMCRIMCQISHDPELNSFGDNDPHQLHYEASQRRDSALDQIIRQGEEYLTEMDGGYVPTAGAESTNQTVHKGEAAPPTSDAPTADHSCWWCTAQPVLEGCDHCNTPQCMCACPECWAIQGDNYRTVDGVTQRAPTPEMPPTPIRSTTSGVASNKRSRPCLDLECHETLGEMPAIHVDIQSIPIEPPCGRSQCETGCHCAQRDARAAATLRKISAKQKQPPSAQAQQEPVNNNTSVLQQYMGEPNSPQFETSSQIHMVNTNRFAPLMDNNDDQPDEPESEDDPDLSDSEVTPSTMVPRPAVSQPKGDDTVVKHVSAKWKPRFEDTKPFSHMFIDNKKYTHPVRGGRQVALALMDYYSKACFIVDLFSKRGNADGIRKLASMTQFHKLPYAVTVYSDGCGSMHLVKQALSELGVKHTFLPPRQPQLNLCERVFAAQVWDQARSLMAHSNSPSEYFAYAVHHAAFLHNITASTSPERQDLSPYQLLYQKRYNASAVVPFYSLAFCHIDKQRRQQLERQGEFSKSEPGRWLGFQDMFSTTSKVVLSGNRIVHTKDLMLDINNHIHHNTQNIPIVDAEIVAEVPVSFEPAAVTDRQAAGGENEEQSMLPDGQSPEADSNPLYGQDFNHTTPATAGSEGEWLEHVSISPIKQDYWYDSTRMPGMHGTPPGESPPMRLAGHDADQLDEYQLRSGRTRRQQANMINHRAAFLATVNTLDELSNDDEQDQALEAAIQANPEITNDPEAHKIASVMMAEQGQKDLSWRKALAPESPIREAAIAAAEEELRALQSTILTLISPEDKRYNELLAKSTPGRIILDVKRNINGPGKVRCRAVKQGHLEDLTSDGSNFVYYSSVSSLVSVRCLCFEPNYTNKRIASIDVRGAFNQSLTFEQMGKEHKYKYVVFTHPVTKEKLLFEARGPLYGEASAPRHWSDTLAEHLISEGFVRGVNETSTFYHKQRRLTLLTYVDDLLMSGEEPDLRWFEERLTHRFDCKPMIVLGTPGVKVLDHLGLELSQDATHTSISMSSYIKSIPDTLGLPTSTFRAVSTPMAADIDPNAPPLSAAKRRIYMKACGCVSWCCSCSRIDAQLALSRCAAFMASPNESAYQAIMRVVSYLIHHADLKLKAPIQPPPDPVNHHWEFSCDSDHSANTSDSKLRCTCGLVVTLNSAPVLWSSSHPSVTCHPKINEAIADTAVCVSEIYAAATAAKKIMALQYAAEEQGLPWPKDGFILQQDNIAAGLFSTPDGCSKSSKRLKHIDLRQSFVRALRDSTVMRSKYIPSAENKSDFLSKWLNITEFRRQRARLMEE